MVPHLKMPLQNVVIKYCEVLQNDGEGVIIIDYTQATTSRGHAEPVLPSKRGEVFAGYETIGFIRDTDRPGE